MNKSIVSLGERARCVSSEFGSKAETLAELSAKGFRVPDGFCLGEGIYREFLSANNLGETISLELGRKRYEDMRWEEMWDASLRIRNFFLKAGFPEKMKEGILGAFRRYLPGAPVVIRSSSLSEDGAVSSFAGIHESFVNISEEANILKHIKLVWASLFSDAALAYRKELGLDAAESAMCVIIQRMIPGKKSGVAFGVNPQNPGQAVIECVSGLNKGLVDGDVEPDRWILDRHEGTALDYRKGGRGRYVIPSEEGVQFTEEPPESSRPEALNPDEIGEIFSALKELEEIFGSPQDMEWTYSGRELYLLQSRPVTGVKKDSSGDRRSFDLSLRRSFENLKALGSRIENELIPGMISQAEELMKKDLSGLSNEELAEEIKLRRQLLEKWNGIYRDDFIPFAHGARLFGEVYNNSVSPEDPYEFLEIISGSPMKSIERNKFLLEVSSRLTSSGDKDLENDIDFFIDNFGVMLPESGDPAKDRENVLSLLKKLAHAPKKDFEPGSGNREKLTSKFLESFPESEKNFAEELLDLAVKSYRLRDDDNIYLGRIEQQLERAMLESRGRLGEKCEKNNACENYEELILALSDPDYTPGETVSGDEKTPAKVVVRARRMRGQSAGKGIARGKARVVKDKADLFALQEGEILVCDSIDPNMTFVIPLAAAIVERRGGMLIHGAIVAREYGLPCVTGIAGATELIRTGDDITVDGYFGLVIRHNSD